MIFLQLFYVALKLAQQLFAIVSLERWQLHKGVDMSDNTLDHVHNTNHFQNEVNKGVF